MLQGPVAGHRFFKGLDVPTIIALEEESLLTRFQNQLHHERNGVRVSSHRWH